MRNVTIAKNKLRKVAARLGDGPILLRVLCRHLNKEFKSMSVRFRSEAADYFSISGYFSPFHYLDPEEGLKYNVLIHYDNKDSKLVPTRFIWNEILLVLVHELRHGYQDKSRGMVLLPFERRPKFKHRYKSVAATVDYLSDYDEIDAHAFEAAYAVTHGIPADWIHKKYKRVLGKYAPTLYQRFLKKLYLFSHK